MFAGEGGVQTARPALASGSLKRKLEGPQAKAKPKSLAASWRNACRGIAFAAKDRRAQAKRRGATGSATATSATGPVTLSSGSPPEPPPSESGALPDPALALSVSVAPEAQVAVVSPDSSEVPPEEALVVKSVAWAAGCGLEVESDALSFLAESLDFNQKGQIVAAYTQALTKKQDALAIRSKNRFIPETPKRTYSHTKLEWRIILGAAYLKWIKTEEGIAARASRVHKRTFALQFWKKPTRNNLQLVARCIEHAERREREGLFGSRVLGCHVRT